MRLINVETLRLETFLGSDIPQHDYAILSHTWGEDEVLFGDMCDPQQPLPTHRKGFSKVKGSCDRARTDGYKYIWIDTCCIDKSSSAELSGAINSMFQWYHQSAICYAYLVDLNAPGEGSVTEMVQSRWFARGWTLQELIAPRHVRFFDYNWEFAGTRQHKSPETENVEAKEISERTGIPYEVLCWLPPQGSPFRRARFKWAPFRDVPRDP